MAWKKLFEVIQVARLGPTQTVRIGSNWVFGALVHIIVVQVFGVVGQRMIIMYLDPQG